MLGYLLNYTDGQKIQFLKSDTQCGSSPNWTTAQFFSLHNNIFVTQSYLIHFQRESFLMVLSGMSVF